MGALYLYAITARASASITGRTGFERAPLLTLPCREIAAVVSPLTEARLGATPMNVWLHEEIVEALMATSPVLPVRWGTVLPGERRLLAVLEAHHDDLAAALEQVRGRVELGLRVLWGGDVWRPPSAFPSSQGPACSAATPGREYLMARVEVDRRARTVKQRAVAMADEIHRPLARLAAENVREVLPTPRMLLTAAYLVDRKRVGTLRAAVDALATAFPALRFLLTGPWPPYHFVTGCVPIEALLADHSSITENPGQQGRGA